MLKKIIIGVVALFVLVAILGSLGESDEESSSSQTEAAPGTMSNPPPVSEPVKDSRCQVPPAALMAAIASGLSKVSGGGTLRDAAAVRSDDFKSAYFVSAEIDGPGIEDDGDVGTWVTNRLEEPGLIYSVNAVAKSFSDWGDGGRTDASFSMSDDGAEASQDCLR